MRDNCLTIRENTRLGGDVEGSVGGPPQKPVNRAGKAEFLIECSRWRRHMRNTRSMEVDRMGEVIYDRAS